MGKTKIEWCEYVINPVVGCSKCSPGCKNCYAERFASRLAKNPLTAGRYAPVVDENGKWNGHITLNTSFLSSSKTAFPGKFSNSKFQKKIFVGSMCDLFNLDAYSRFDEYWKREYGRKNSCHSAIYVLGNLWNYFAKNRQNNFFLLTKRPEGIVKAFDTILRFWPQRTGAPWPLPNVWIGVTVCDQLEANEKIPVLMRTPAVKRFVSVEPMLGAIDLEEVRFTYSPGFFGDALRWHHLPYGCKGEDYPALDWVICGAETGPGARPMDLQWARDLRDQCKNAQVPFFFKKCSPKQQTPDDLMAREFPE